MRKEIKGKEAPGMTCSTGPALMVTVYDYGYGCTGRSGTKSASFRISSKQHLDCHETPKPSTETRYTTASAVTAGATFTL